MGKLKKSLVTKLICHIERRIKNILNSTKTTDDRRNAKRQIEYYKSNN